MVARKVGSSEPAFLRLCGNIQSMSMTPTDDNAILKLVRDQRRRGTSYFDIERMFGVPAPRAEQLMTDYYKDRARGGSLEEARYLQLERFEAMIGPLMDKVEMGDVKASEALIKLLTGINDTLGLVKEQKSIEITVINQQQGEAVFKMIDYVLTEQLKIIQSLVTDQEVLGEIEDRWDENAPVVMGRAREQIVDAEVITS